MQVPPIFQGVMQHASEPNQGEIRRFFQLVDPATQNYDKGGNLTELVDLAHKIQIIVQRDNPFFDLEGITSMFQWVQTPETIAARQLHLDCLSVIKSHVATAIAAKRAYYNSHWLGKITQFVLKLLGMWNHGYTKAIVAAEDFLLFWDTRRAIATDDPASGQYWERPVFLFPVSLDWTNQNLDTTRFYNYDTARQIGIGPPGALRYRP